MLYWIPKHPVPVYKDFSLASTSAPAAVSGGYPTTAVSQVSTSQMVADFSPPRLPSSQIPFVLFMMASLPPSAVFTTISVFSIRIILPSLPTTLAVCSQPAVFSLLFSLPAPDSPRCPWLFSAVTILTTSQMDHVGSLFTAPHLILLPPSPDREC